MPGVNDNKRESQKEQPRSNHGPSATHSRVAVCHGAVTSRLGMLPLYPQLPEEQCSGDARHPFGLAFLAVRHCVENQLHAAGNADLIENPQKVFLNGVLAQPQLACDVTIA